MWSNFLKRSETGKNGEDMDWVGETGAVEGISFVVMWRRYILHVQYFYTFLPIHPTRNAPDVGQCR
jgi:hypothetical protein